MVKEIKYIDYAKLSTDDIARHPVVLEVLDIYNQEKTTSYSENYLNCYPW